MSLVVQFFGTQCVSRKNVLTPSLLMTRAVLSVQDLTTATPSCAAHPGQLSTNSSAFRTTLPGSSANVEDAPTPARCSCPSTCEAAGHVQGRNDDLQGAPHSNAGVSQRSVADPRAGTDSAIIRGSDDGHPTDQHRSRSMCFQRRGSIDLKLTTFLLSDCVTALQHLNDT